MLVCPLEERFQCNGDGGVGAFGLDGRACPWASPSAVSSGVNEAIVSPGSSQEPESTSAGRCATS